MEPDRRPSGALPSVIKLLLTGTCAAQTLPPHLDAPQAARDSCACLLAKTYGGGGGGGGGGSTRQCDR